jgi:hypothetical protein
VTARPLLAAVPRPPVGERLAVMETWAVDHDKVCAERYRLLIAVIGFGATAIMGAAGWGLNQVHEDQKAQLTLLQDLSRRTAIVRPDVIYSPTDRRP